MNNEKKFHLELGTPVVLTQGAVGDQDWGHYQFPQLARTETGSICASWEYCTDTIDYESVMTSVISDDGGNTWRAMTAGDRIAHPMMKNGKRFMGFVRKGAHTADYMDKYTPAVTVGLRKYFFAEDIKETEDTAVWAEEIDPATGEISRFACRIHWPNAAVSMHSGIHLYPLTMVFALCNPAGFLDFDGELYYVLYTCGFDAEAKTKEAAIPKYIGVSGVYVFKSADCGRTWDYVSQILVDDETFNPAPRFEGFDEPLMRVMPDGSVVMLIRTGSNHPSYITRSTDRCRTWSKPVKFDDIGVLPQLCPLPCGVTLASYGRPEMRIRATADPAGLIWEDPIRIDDIYGMKMENPANRSCFYTRLIEVADNAAILAYTDFQYPNADGVGVKTVLARRITVVTDD